MTSAYAFRSSHRGLESALPDEPWPPATCDAVVVLNHWHPGRVQFAVRLAAVLGCPVLVLGTRGFRTAPPWRAPARPRGSPPACAVRLLWPATPPLPGLTTPAQVADEGLKYQDIAMKRTLGLALARLLRWKRILFLDDDVSMVTPAQVGRAAGLLAAVGPATLVGWDCPRFPDNSVVCHARRAAGLPQATFFGGGAMVVAVEPADADRPGTPFFPPVYNEDWLFLFEILHGGRLFLTDTIQQRSFDPFRHAMRAYEEEFGDLLAEGLFHLLHEGQPVGRGLEVEFWADVAAVRRDLIQDLRRRTAARLDGRSQVEDVRRFKVLGSLDAAERRHDDRHLPHALASFVRAWQNDLTVWRVWFANLPEVPTLRDALDHLGVKDAEVIDF